MNSDDLKHEQELRKIYSARLHILEEQAAVFGQLYCPPHILMEIKDVKEKIEALGNQTDALSELTDSLPIVSNSPSKLTNELRRLRVFLCHSSKDKPAVRDLYKRLRADGFDPWLDEEDIVAGSEWRREIPKAVRATDVVIVCLSKAGIAKTGYIQKEIAYALDEADKQPESIIFIIPLRLEDCKVPERLSHWQWVNLFGDKDKGYNQLLVALRKRASELSLPVNPEVAFAPIKTQLPDVIYPGPRSRKIGGLRVIISLIGAIAIYLAILTVIPPNFLRIDIPTVLPTRIAIAPTVNFTQQSTPRVPATLPVATLKPSIPPTSVVPATIIQATATPMPTPTVATPTTTPESPDISAIYRLDVIEISRQEMLQLNGGSIKSKACILSGCNAYIDAPRDLLFSVVVRNGWSRLSSFKSADMVVTLAEGESKFYIQDKWGYNELLPTAGQNEIEVEAGKFYKIVARK